MNTAAKPAKTGSYLIVFFTGMGAANPAAATGMAAPLAPLESTVLPVTATIGGQPAQIAFAGLTPSLAGVSQANILVPNLPAGTYPVVLTQNGRVSNAGLVAITP